MALVDEALEEAWGIINTDDGWKEEKNEKGDIVMSKKNKKGMMSYDISLPSNNSVKLQINQGIFIMSSHLFL